METEEERFHKRYSVNRAARLGEGRYGRVYRAIDRETEQEVAIKECQIEDSDKGLPSTTMREVTILKTLADEPNIIRLIDIFYDFDASYAPDRSMKMVFEYIPMDLKRYIYQSKPLPKRIVKSLTKQLCRGLYAMHSRGLIHRDLKPQNILVDNRIPDEPILKICDMGLGRQQALPVPRLTHEVGTLYYRSPEVLLGSKTYAYPIDVWSVGCTFAEMITKETLFKGDNEVTQLMEIFSVLGTPDETEFGNVRNLKEWHEFPNWTDNVLKRRFKNGIDPNAFDLLSKMLIIDPAKRIQIKDALKHPYFADECEYSDVPDKENAKKPLTERL